VNFISFRYDEQKVKRVLTALENRVRIHGKEGKMANPFFVDPNADTCSNTMNIGLRMGQLAQTVKEIRKQRVKRMVRIQFKAGLISKCFSIWLHNFVFPSKCTKSLS
jgi:hypothetical protein